LHYLGRGPPVGLTAAVRRRVRRPVPAECQAQADAYVAAAQAQNTQGAISAYTALLSQCPDLLAQVAAQAGMPLPQRKMGLLSGQYFGGRQATARPATARLATAAAPAGSTSGSCSVSAWPSPGK
jgi:hypothetical protein